MTGFEKWRGSRMKPEDMIAVVTGAAGGTGPAVVKALRDEVKAVVGVIRGEDVTFEKVGDREFEARANLTNSNSVASLVNKINHHVHSFHAWINLVGGYTFSGPVVETNWNDWSRMIDLNFRSVLNCCRYIFPILKAQGFGRIINFGSAAGLEGMAGSGPYAVSKAAVINLTLTLSKEGKDHDITANVFVPRAIDTPSNRRAMPDADFSKWTPPEKVASEIFALIISSRTGEVISL